MKLDLFLPMLRKPKARTSPRGRGLLYRAARRILPGRLFSDPFTKRRGLARRFLRGIGPSWLAAPVRRVVQGACFLAFLWLFFFVCWPDSARPAETWNGWKIAGVDARTGRSTLVKGGPVPPAIRVGRRLHAVEEGPPEGLAADLGAFTVTRVRANELAIEPAGPRTPAELDRLSLAAGAWSLREADPARWPSHHADNLAAKERVAAEAFLVIDPLLRRLATITCPVVVQKRLVLQALKFSNRTS